jgi:hypothetical protein
MVTMEYWLKIAMASSSYGPDLFAPWNATGTVSHENEGCGRAGSKGLAAAHAKNSRHSGEGIFRTCSGEDWHLNFCRLLKRMLSVFFFSVL